jgi:ribosomal protein L23
LRRSWDESRTSDASAARTADLRKATFVADKYEQVIFRVASDATKPEVKGAVELLFKVSVESVQIANVKGKHKKFGRSHGSPQQLEKGLRLPAAGPGD